jgi:hypothetical protein
MAIPGRPRPDAPVHVSASRELTAAMRQARVAAGDNATEAIRIVNDTIDDLYPQAGVAGSAGARSTPHRLSDQYLRWLEKGHNGRRADPKWLAASAADDPGAVYASRVPPWVVRVYDVAFGADGFLVDMYGWHLALLADQDKNPPRQRRNLPAGVPAGQEYAALAEHFPSATGELVDVLRDQAAALVALRGRLTTDQAWTPLPQDGSGSLGDGEEEAPEGLVSAPGQRFVMRWLLHDTGTADWRDRLIFRVGDPSAGIRTPPFLVLADTAPGGTVEIRCPVRAPETPGTYRACLKMGWPDGTYCFPTTLLGLIVTLIVPPPDLADTAQEWPHHEH